jgi:hypothetical protein
LREALGVRRPVLRAVLFVRFFHLREQLRPLARESLRESEEVFRPQKEPPRGPLLPAESQRFSEPPLRGQTLIARQLDASNGGQLCRRGDAFEQRGLTRAVFADKEGDRSFEPKGFQRPNGRNGEGEGTVVAFPAAERGEVDRSG